MRSHASREVTYTMLARFSGLALVVLCVFFQRRGMIHWTELLFLGLCIGLQETFLRLHSLRRWRAPMMVAYSLMPLMLVLYHGAEIQRYRGDFVRIVLHTPLPLVLVSVQIMVLYVRESARLVSVVLVLALFSTVIGVRRPVDDAVWPWLAGITVLAAVYLMLQHPGMLFQGVYVSRRKRTLPPAGRPGGIMRNAFYAVMPLFIVSVLAMSVLLYFAVPRVKFGSGPDHEIAQDVEPRDPGAGRGLPQPPPRRPGRGGPATVSGLGSGVDLGDFGEIKRSHAPALNIVRLEPVGEPIDEVYLRAFTYATFDGYGWSALPASSATVRPVPPGDPRVLHRVPHRGDGTHAERVYRVEIREAGLGDDGQIPVVTEPVAFAGYAGPLYYDSEAHTVTAPRMVPGDSYMLEAVELVAAHSRMKAELRGARASPSPDPRYLELPPGMHEQLQQRFLFYERQRAIAEAADRDVPVNDRGAYACAVDIVRTFHESTMSGSGDKAWVYSLEQRPAPGRDAIVRFLDTTTAGAERFGHCEYFATAMCMLLRSYGVPSRLCAGFHGSGADEGGVVEVTAASAHAWVEVYFERFGWVAFDPTPPEGTAAQEDEQPADPEEAPPEDEGEDPQGESEADDGETEDEPAEPQVEKQGDWFERFDESEQRRLFEGAGAHLKDGWRRAEGFLASLTAWMPGVLPSSGMLRALLLLSPLWVAIVLVLRLRRKRKKMEARVLKQMGEGGRDRERGLYFQLLLVLTHYGFQKRPSETPREFARRVLRKGGGRHMPIRELTELYYGLRFGGNAELEAEFKRKLAKYAEALKREADAHPRPA